MPELYGLTNRDKVRIGATVSRSEAAVSPGQRFATNIPASADAYAGQFKVTDTSTAEADQVDISAGKVINGTTVTTVAAATDFDVTDALYLSLEVWHTTSWQTGYLAAATYPTQAKKTPGDYWAIRVLIASRATVDDAWVRQKCGEFHNTRLVE